MIHIRAASTTDARALAELRWEFRSAQNPPAEAHDAFVKRCAMWMRRELQSSGAWKAWVALDNQVAVGQVWLQVIQKIPNPSPLVEAEQIAYLSNLFVTVASRGGTGTQLLEAALAWCRSNHVDRVVLWPSRRSVTLYLGHGFSHGGEVMELKIRK